MRVAELHCTLCKDERTKYGEPVADFISNMYSDLLILIWTRLTQYLRRYNIDRI